MNQKNNNDFDEVNLADIQKATASLLETVGFFVYKTIQYFSRKWMFIGVGLVFGLALGAVKYMSYKNEKQPSTLNNSGILAYNILVAPKYKSIDYLDQLAQTKFQNKLGYTQIKKVTVEGLDDVYPFLSQDSLAIQVFQAILSKTETVDDAIKSYVLSKNYPYQVLKIEATNDFNIEKFVLDLQNHFDQHPYYAARKQIELKTIALEKEAFEEELQAITSYATLAENKSKERSEQAQYISLLARKNEIFSRLKQIEVEQLENKHVLFVLDYIENHESLMNNTNSIAKQTIKDIVKLVFLFLLLGMGIDFVKYYRTKE